MFSGGIVSDQPTVAGALVAVFGPDARVETKRSVGGGCINQTGRLTLTDGRTVFLKENSGQLTGMFQREAEGLAALAAADGPRVPQPLADYCGDRDEGQFLLWEDLSSAPRQAHFCEDIAILVLQAGYRRRNLDHATLYLQMFQGVNLRRLIDTVGDDGLDICV